MILAVSLNTFELNLVSNNIEQTKEKLKQILKCLFIQIETDSQLAQGILKSSEFSYH